MDLNTESLLEVFNALDIHNQGHITVNQFTSALEQFYNSLRTEKSDILSNRPSLDISNIVNALDPENDGIISFGDFQSAFQEYFAASADYDARPRQMTLTLQGRKVSIIPEEYATTDIDNDMKTEDSGFPEYEAPEQISDSPTFSSGFARSQNRKTWPNYVTSVNNSMNSRRDSQESQFSGTHSEQLLDDLESMKNQMRKMEERVESLVDEQLGGQESASQRLRDQNTRLHATVAILEERLKETESRYKRDLNSERTHMESLIGRSRDSHEKEIETLRSRLRKLDEDLTENSKALSKAKGELDNSQMSHSRYTESLNDAEEKVASLQEKVNTFSSNDNAELKQATEERDRAVIALKELENAAFHNKISNRSNNDTVAQIEELQQIAHSLQQDNNDLQNKLSDVNEELLGRAIVNSKVQNMGSEEAFDSELNKMTKDEICVILSQEKLANADLRSYLDSLLDKIILMHPEMLESKNG